jgi:hypothetical protein
MSKNKAAKKLPLCECGCETTTKGGRFIPGHDAILKKALIDAALGGSKRAENKLEILGWSKFLDARRQRLGRRKRTTPVVVEHGVKSTRRRGRPRKVEKNESPGPTTADASEQPKSE